MKFSVISTMKFIVLCCSPHFALIAEMTQALEVYAQADTHTISA